jgi:hypothetical protein
MEEEKKETLKVKREEKIASVVQVPTEYGIAFQIDEDTTLDVNQLLIRIYNDIQKLKRGLL